MTILTHPDPSLQYVKGVGPARAEILAKTGLRALRDVLELVPRDWQDRRWRFNLKEAPTGEHCALRGLITEVTIDTLKPGLGMAQAEFKDASGTLRATWFKRITPRYDVFQTLRNRLQPGRALFVYGVMDWGPQGRQIHVDDYALGETLEKLPPAEDIHFGRIVPSYTAPEGVPERLLRTLMAAALAQAAPEVLRRYHFPANWAEKEEARRELAHEEFRVLETALALVRRKIANQHKPHHYDLKRTLLTPFREHMGFTFTDAQKRVIREIFDDMRTPSPMNRLLQGDVGSGKTVVALSAILLAVENGGQTALMAPTEILAEQHAATIRKLLQELPVKVALLTSRQPPTLRKKTLAAIESGEIDIAIGTHALLEPTVRFKALHLCVIDEQHRFGVEHRSRLRQKGRIPDVLVMTATPIPRTLALTLYGDLDVSTIDQLPPGRTPIMTVHLHEEEAWVRVRRAVQAGQQAYIVYPLVEESDKLALKAAVREIEHLRKNHFQGLRLGLLHGQMKSAEKDAVMEQFRSGQLDILVATTIIEVGIHVSNATVMVIQHAERFGLATLHQLRGRVGRGADASECLLIADTKTADAQKRIRIMTETQDGIRISEEDLRLRGPGEVLGASQHGLPEFRYGDLIKDAALIQQARHGSDQLLKEDPDLKHPANRLLRETVQKRFGRLWSLGQTG